MRASRVLLAALAAAQVAYGRVPGQRGPASTRGLVGLMLGASATEAVEARGLRRGALPVAAAGALGFAAELAGVATGRPFGHYHYSGKLGPRVGGVPLLAAAAWAMMARPAWVVAGRLTRRAGARVAARRRRADRVGRLPRPADGARGVLDVAGRRALRGHPGVELPRLVGDRRSASSRVWSLLDGDDAGRATATARSRSTRGRGLGETFANAVLWRRPRVAAAGARRDGRVRRARRCGGDGAGRRHRRRRRRARGRRSGSPRSGTRSPCSRPAGAPGGKCGRVARDGFTLGLRAVAADDAVGVRGAVRRHRRAAAPRSSSCCRSSRSPATASPTARGFDLSADPARSRAALEAWRPGAGAEWERFLATCAGMWRASEAGARRARRRGRRGCRRPARRGRRRSTSRASSRGGRCASSPARTPPTRGCGW